MSAPAPAPSAAKPRTKRKPWVCSFCKNHHHRSCLRAARVRVRETETKWRVDLWLCKCSDPDCSKAPMCTECKHEGAAGEIDMDTWLCADQYACQARLTAKRDANPVWRQLQDCRTASAVEKRRKRLMEELVRSGVDPDVDATIDELHDAAEAKRAVEKTKQPPKAKAPPRPTSGVCECGCEGKTKGGRFVPGHDAKLASRLVALIKEYDRDAFEEMKRRGWLKKLPKALRERMES